MGADIHPRSEVRHNGKWIMMSDEPCRDRHYTSFAALADVRNYDGIEVMAEPRGLPADVSAGVRDLVEWDDCSMGDHSFSWFTITELAEYLHNHEGEELHLLREWVKSLIWYASDGRTTDDVRVVFGFDN